MKWECEHCGRLNRESDPYCYGCGSDDRPPLPTQELDIGELTIIFSPNLVGKDADGKECYRAGIIGQMQLECKYMPAYLRKRVEGWVRRACEAQDIGKRLVPSG